MEGLEVTSVTFPYPTYAGAQAHTHTHARTHATRVKRLLRLLRLSQKRSWAGLARSRYVGTGPAAEHYGAAVYGNAQDVEHRVEVVVHVKDGTSGKTVGHTQTTHTVRTAHPAHSIDPTRRHVAAQSYGPADRTPPAPGIPTLPGHIGSPIRR